MKLRCPAYLCATKYQVEDGVEVNEVNVFTPCDLADCLTIGFQLEILWPSQVLVNDVEQRMLSGLTANERAGLARGLGACVNALGPRVLADNDL